MKGKYVAFNCIYDEIEEFNTFEEAVKWLEAIDYDEGIPSEVVNGGNFIAKITHRSKYKITDSKDKYCQKVESYNDCVNCEIGEDDCETEPWPYSDDVETVGEVIYEEVTNGTL